jgi:hypothetical protein
MYLLQNKEFESVEVRRALPNLKNHRHSLPFIYVKYPAKNISYYIL